MNRAEKIKKEYPKLPILISGDALYANKTVLEICHKNKWNYIIRFKEGAIPTLYEEISKIVKENNESAKTGYEFVTKINYSDYKINIIRFKETKKEEEEKETEFTYITDLSITNRNIESSIYVGRKRWKIENEGFNKQKNGTFDIGHLYSKNATAIKVHYLMIQIAHIIRQMLEKGNIGLKEEIKEQKIKIKEISSQIKKMLTSTLINLVNAHSTQLRFDS